MRCPLAPIARSHRPGASPLRHLLACRPVCFRAHRACRKRTFLRTPAIGFQSQRPCMGASVVVDALSLITTGRIRRCYVATLLPSVSLAGTPHLCLFRPCRPGTCGSRLRQKKQNNVDHQQRSPATLLPWNGVMPPDNLPLPCCRDSIARTPLQSRIPLSLLACACSEPDGGSNHA